MSKANTELGLMAANTQVTVEYCLAHPQWRLCIQTHKVVDIA